MPARASSVTGVMLRRRWLVLATFLAVILAAAVVSKTLDKVYSTSATLLVALGSDTPSFDSVQASQAIARSYADIIDSPNIADRVAGRVGATRSEVLAATRFEVIPETQLLKVTAQGPTPERAKQLADAYAAVFPDYAQRHLANTTQATITVADAAPIVGAPSRPRTTLYVLVAAVLGLVLAGALALLRERLDHRLRTADDVEAQFDVPVLARIPRRGLTTRSATAFEEALRILHTNVQFAPVGGSLRSIAVTSAARQEGRTTIAANLAITISEIGREVILVEADLRRPALQRELIPDVHEPLTPGLSNYLADDSTLEESLHATAHPGLRLIPAGPLPPRPSALLESSRARSTASVLKEQAEFVIYDCPPLNVGADASLVTDYVDGVVLIVDLRSSDATAVRQALRQLEAVQAPLLGFVLNRDRGAAPRTYDPVVRRRAARVDEVERPQLSGRRPPSPHEEVPRLV